MSLSILKNVQYLLILCQDGWFWLTCSKVRTWIKCCFELEIWSVIALLFLLLAVNHGEIHLLGKWGILVFLMSNRTISIWVANLGPQCADASMVRKGRWSFQLFSIWISDSMVGLLVCYARGICSVVVLWPINLCTDKFENKKGLGR